MRALLPCADDQLEWALSHAGSESLRQRLIRGEVGAYRIVGTDAAVLMAAGVTKDTAQRALWIVDLEGHVGHRPKDNLCLMQAVFEDCDDIARASDCAVIRIEPGDRAGWKLRMLPDFGFMPLAVGDVTVMQKELDYGR